MLRAGSGVQRWYSRSAEVQQRFIRDGCAQRFSRDGAEGVVQVVQCRSSAECRGGAVLSRCRGGAGAEVVRWWCSGGKEVV